MIGPRAAAGGRRCQNCGGPLVGRRPHARFCGRRCQTAHLRAHGPTERAPARAWIGAAVPAAVLATIDDLAQLQHLTRADWLRLAIGDRLQTDSATSEGQQ